ncbi:predicted protein [Naegleria gruberi]|uniref:Predicted protein n=1 Tax=Naegleria gruberi TaxID=5762 RepID=D2VCZ3_NAEGR|nr:uncharacterized protein NAEGRDRAFT_66740 [Naegleria gruberi]EFC45390.1 predicted protein [Naegleria gruberi]|eukprot:XP_002678134.1 predicted protein [Naegleria gruberi strain NEG-M]
MSNSFNLLEHASNSDPLEIASSAKKEVKQEKPKVEEKKPVQQQRKPKPTSAPSEVVEEGFQGTRSKTRGGRQQHQGYQPPKKGRTFDRHVSGTESAASKPKTVAVSEFLDTASIEKIKERRDKELLEGPKQPRGPRQDRPERTDRKGGKPQNKGQKGAKPASGQKKPRPVINKEKDFPALSPQN